MAGKKAESAVKKGEQDLYDLTKEERDKQRNEAREELKTGRKKKKAGKKIVKFARKNFAREIIKDENDNDENFDSNKTISADYKGFLEPAVNKFIEKYYKLPTHLNYKNGEKYKNSYYFSWSGLEAFKKDLEHIFINEKNAFKCNISMAYILYKNIYEDDDPSKKVIGYTIKYYYSSINNKSLFEHPIEIHDRKTLNNFINKSVIDIANQKGVTRDDTQWSFYQYLHYEVVIYKTNLTIGNAISLPEHFYENSNEKNIIKFDDHNDYLCFWRCLAVFLAIVNSPGIKYDYRRFEKPAKNLYMQFYGKKYTDDYKGIKYTPYSSYYDDETCEDYDKEIKTDEIDKVEELLKINIHIYTQDDKEHAEIDRRNSGKYDKDIYLLRYNNHFCLIKDIKAFIHSFRCRKCGKSFSSFKSCGRHEKGCSDLCKHEFPGGFCAQTQNTFQKLENYGIEINDCNNFFDHFIVYDFETILSKTEIKKTKNLQYTNKHNNSAYTINADPSHVFENNFFL